MTLSRYKIIVLTTLAIFTFLGSFVCQAKSKTAVKASAYKKVTIHVTSNGAPSGFGVYSAENFNVLYNKIENGNFTDRDFNLALANKLRSQTVSTSNKVSLSDAVSFGKGIKNSPAITVLIIKTLYDDDFHALLQQWNDTPLGSGAFYFTYPNNVSRRYLTSDGIGKASLPLGFTLLFNGSGQIVDNFIVTKKTAKINLDTIKDSNIKTELLSVPKKSLENDGSYSVEPGQELTYKISINPTISTIGGTLNIDVPANLSIDSVSVPVEESSLISNPYNANSIGGGIVNGQIKDSTLYAIQNKLRNQLAKRYSVHLPLKGNKQTITIRAYYNPSATLTTNIYLKGYVFKNTQLTFSAFDTNNLNLSMKVTAFTGLGQFQSNTPNINTSGINFATVDAKKKTLVSGVSYFLGKKMGQNYYLYSNNGGWQTVGKSIPKSVISNNNFQKFSYGNQYVINAKGNALRRTIDLNSNLWDFNIKKQKKIISSLIKFNGLSNYTTYFLYECHTPTSHTAYERPQFFTVFRKMSRLTTGAVNIENSQNNAKNQWFLINGIIPDYSAGAEEYNLLYTNSSRSSTNGEAYFRIIASIILFSAIIFVIAYIVLIRDVK